MIFSSVGITSAQLSGQCYPFSLLRSNASVNLSSELEAYLRGTLVVVQGIDGHVQELISLAESIPGTIVLGIEIHCLPVRLCRSKNKRWKGGWRPVTCKRIAQGGRTSVATFEWKYGRLGVMLGGEGFHHLSTPVHMPGEKSTAVVLSTQADHAEKYHTYGGRRVLQLYILVPHQRPG
jgi:hypothetical protein